MNRLPLLQSGPDAEDAVDKADAEAWLLAGGNQGSA